MLVVQCTTFGLFHIQAQSLYRDSTSCGVDSTLCYLMYRECVHILQSGKDELHKIRDDFTTSGGTGMHTHVEFYVFTATLLVGPTADEDDLLDLLDQAIA